MKRCFLLLLLALASGGQTTLAEVSLELQPQPIAVKTSSYTARVAPDGCLTNFAVDGLEFFAPGVSISRGSYFYLNGPLKLPNVEQSEGNVVEAAGESSAIRYEFQDSRLTCQLTNKTDKQLIFFIVLNGYVGAASIDGGKLQPTPLNGDHSHARFFLGKSVLKIEGFDKLWGPWQGPHQVVQATLKPAEERELVLVAGKTNEDERLQILELKAAPEELALTISSPREYQVIQRSTKNRGKVLVSGRTHTAASSIEVRFRGDGLTSELQQWQPVRVHANTRKFGSWLAMPAGGWYRLEARAVDRGATLAEASIDRFGIGEVFVGAGQSNSTNSGQFKTKQTSDMVSSFSGTRWQLANDPQPGVADQSQGGSFWPAFGDKMYRELGVPIGVATTGYGGTSVNQWQPDGDLFQRWLMTRVHQLGPQGFRAVLWHQGESDVHMPQQEYFAKLRNTILASTKQAGWEFPWFVAQVSYHNPENVRFESVRSAQAALWNEHIASPGPDTDVLTGDHRDFDGKGIHFSPKGLKAHGEMWADKLIPYVNNRLADEANTVESVPR